jgi:hypothetical protein
MCGVEVGLVGSNKSMREERRALLHEIRPKGVCSFHQVRTQQEDSIYKGEGAPLLDT